MNRFDSLFALTSATFIGVLTFLYLPIAIYSANPTEFQSATIMVVPWLLLGTAVAISLLWAPCLILQGVWRQRYSYVLGAIAIVSWLSGVFFVNDFGLLDGASFDLHKHRKALQWQSMVLGAVLAPAFWLSLRFPHYVRRGLSVLTIGLVLSTSFTLYANPPALGRPQNPPVHVDIQQLSRFDAKHNLLIVLMQYLRQKGCEARRLNSV